MYKILYNFYNNLQLAHLSAIDSRINNCATFIQWKTVSPIKM